MVTLQKRWLLFSRVLGLFIIFFLVFSVSSSFITTRPVKASNWAGWDAINSIYYNQSQEDPHNQFLSTAASELKTYLQQMSSRSWTVVTNTSPAPPAIYLNVNATQLSTHGDEAFRLVVNNNGVTITGKTALAVREGAYYLLDEKLGVRWFFRNTAWTIVPTSLVDPGAIDEIHEPDYFWRQLLFFQTYGSPSDFASWIAHNRLVGAEWYEAYQNYGAILDYAVGWYSMTTQQRIAYYNAHPTYFYPTGGYVGGWQLNMADSSVRAMAIAYARSFLSDTYGTSPYDALSYGAVSIAPNDGGTFNPPYDSSANIQEITDLVYGGANAVAADISGDYPGKYVTVYCYADYSGIPSIELEPNIIAAIARIRYNNATVTDYELIKGLEAKGIKVGWYDYTVSTDTPRINYDDMNIVNWLNDNGIGWYDTECRDCWGGRSGIEYYLLSKLLWDTSSNVDDLLADFYSKAFGPASTVMQKYYEVRDTDSVSLAQSFNYLSQAETLAAGNSAVLTRIRQLEYYNRWAWKYLNVGITNLTLSDLESFYTFVCKVAGTYVLDYPDIEPALRAELVSRGLTDGQVTALQDFTAPTTGQTATWLSEALSALGGYMTGPEYIDPKLLDLEALDDTSTASVTPLCGNNRDILVYSGGNESVTVRAKTAAQFSIGWYNTYGVLIDTWTQNSPCDWTLHNFTANEPGYYRLHVNKAMFGGSTYTYVDVPNRPAAIVADFRTDINIERYESYYILHSAPEFTGTNTQYFYVPAGTDNFTFCTTVVNPANHVSGSLVDSNNVSHTFNFSTLAGYESHDPPNPADTITLTNPVAGLWKLIINNNPNFNYFWFRGIPPLVWHDPEYLLVPAAGSSAPPVLSPIGDKVVQPGQLLQFTISATDPDNDPLTYSASNLPPWATFTPATRTFSGTANQTGTYTNVQFIVSDGILTASENITITVNAASPIGRADVNNDGAVNILDTILIVQHWGQSGAGGWVPEDVNNDGTISILDIILVGQNWTG